MRIDYSPSFPVQHKAVVRRAVGLMRRLIAPLVDSVMFYGAEHPDAQAVIAVQLPYRQAAVGVTSKFTDASEVLDEREQVRILVHELSHILTASQAMVLDRLIERIEPTDGPARKLLADTASDANEADTTAVARAVLLLTGEGL